MSCCCCGVNVPVCAPANAVVHAMNTATNENAILRMASSYKIKSFHHAAHVGHVGLLLKVKTSPQTVVVRDLDLPNEFYVPDVSYVVKAFGAKNKGREDPCRILAPSI